MYGYTDIKTIYTANRKYDIVFEMIDGTRFTIPTNDPLYTDIKDMLNKMYRHNNNDGWYSGDTYELPITSPVKSVSDVQKSMLRGMLIEYYRSRYYRKYLYASGVRIGYGSNYSDKTVRALKNRLLIATNNGYATLTLKGFALIRKLTGYKYATFVAEENRRIEFRNEERNKLQETKEWLVEELSKNGVPTDMWNIKGSGNNSLVISCFLNGKKFTYTVTAGLGITAMSSEYVNDNNSFANMQEMMASAVAVGNVLAAIDTVQS